MKKNILVMLSALLLISCKMTKEFYDSGELKKIGRTSSDLKNGEWKFYHKNGTIFQKGKYLNGKETGVWEIYHENGKLHQIGKFNNGKQHGEWKFFHENGNREGVGKLDNGTLQDGDGTLNMYDIEGKLLEVQNFKNGKNI